MGTDLIIQLAVVFLLLLTSAFFSSSETALFSLSKIRLKHLSEQGNRQAQLVEHLSARPEQLLTTILVGNTLVNQVATVLATSTAIALWGERGMALAAILLTFGVLVFGELLPKTIAAVFSEQVGLRVAAPIYWLSRLFAPLTTVIERLSKHALRKAGSSPLASPTFTHEEFETMLSVGQEEGTFAPHETQMLQGVTQLKDRQVKEILKTHRMDVVGLRHNITYEELRQVIVTQQFSRYPVYRDSLDQVLGVLYAKDLFALSREDRKNFDVTRVMRKNIILVPETREISSLFREMKAIHMHMAIVLDEYGGTLGILTLEDILETIVGSIEDETDTDEVKMIVEMTANKAVITSNLPIHTFNAEFGTHLPNGEVETVGGFVLKETGRLPARGETLLWGDLRFTVLGLRGNRISLIRVDRRIIQGASQDERSKALVS